MKRPGNLLLCILLGMSFTLYSCYPDSDLLDIEDYDIVATFFDTQTDFSTLRTYVMPDSVIHLVASDEDPSDINRQWDAQIISDIARNMQEAGFTREPDQGGITPDVVVLVAVTTTDWVAYTSYPYYDYWGYYPGWGYWDPWGPSWGIYYPWYSVAYNYTTGSIFIDMVNPNERDDENELLPSVWVGAINGLAEGSAVETSARITRSIDQCFEQSPYLGPN